ncbi:MAG: radical SAM protein [Oscillibacter sp.]|jgi:DNA repair photolyase|uniref:SPL family radical SAM protein n=1 Tax=uncultured Oscillibacter sp. TaxID=876091 RepID=UPI00217322F4|nr:radical SAM protein [uncultured Oscillibacter sp.]MCI9644125.1 radical SAM protein [Oscillibacter sp.]
MEYIPAKTIVNRTKDPSWFGTEYNMNIYRGCCHGCIYCDSRSECYHNDNFDQVKAKADALRIIRDDLAHKAKVGVVATGSMSDPYNPFEEELQLTRRALTLLEAYGFGVAIATKSGLIVRDIDVLASIHRTMPVICKITLTTCDDVLASQVEPYAPSPSLRLAAAERLSTAGLFTGILMMPILPFLEDNPENIREIVDRAADAGARFVYPALGMTCRAGQREYFYHKLEEQFPGQGLAERYRKRYGPRYQCPSPKARALWEVFQEACNRRGLLYTMGRIVTASRRGHETDQLSLF